MSDLARILLIGLVSGLVAFGIGVVVQRRRAGRLQRVSRLGCSVRVVDGEHAGLSGKWWAGEATLSPGRIRFVRFTGGLRFLRRRAVEIQVADIEVSERRSPTVREALSVSPDTDVIRLVTPTSTLEWAVLGSQLHWAVDCLSPSA
ncbi:hypothetical protein ACIBCH_17340 [Amycolatopsis thailandensis]|uniref:hypothetical protein n=1 Tax=Amycolatopsis thailandensis TaxID=589330 RepID=UPI00379C7F2F